MSKFQQVGKTGRGDRRFDNRADVSGEPRYLKKAEREQMRMQKLQALSQPPREQQAAIDALALFFEQTPEVSEALGRCLFMRADFSNQLFADRASSGQALCTFAKQLFCEQTGCQAYRRLRDNCQTTEPNQPLSGASAVLLRQRSLLQVAEAAHTEATWPVLFDSVVYVASSQREENRRRLGAALALVRPGGLLIWAAANDLGAQSLEKNFAQFLKIDFKLSKFHSRVFAAYVPDFRNDSQFASLAELAEESPAGAGCRLLSSTGYYSLPGIFSWDKIDGGSALLAEYLQRLNASKPDTFKGLGADFGSGYGYLSCRMLEQKNFSAQGLDLYENELSAVEAGQLNVADVLNKNGSGVKVEHHWADVLFDVPEKHYDWVVMNPPFHQGRGRRLDLGRAFVQTAASALKPGGCLRMVVNITLLYEDVIAESFKRFEKVAENNSFKVYEAWR